MKHLSMLVFGLLGFAIAAHADQYLDNLDKAIRNQLGSQYSLAQGYYGQIGYDDCARLIKAYGSCLGANPAAPYLVPYLPSRNGEHVDPYYGSSMSESKQGKTYRILRRLAEREAIVTIMKIPPKAAYFSMQTYLFSVEKNQTNSSSNLGGSSLPSGNLKNPNRAGVFNSIGDSINNASIARQLGVSEAWGNYILVITTGDSKTDQSLRAKLYAMGIPPKHIFTERIGTAVDRLGLTSTSDELTFLMRYVFPDNTTSGNTFRNAPTIRVFRALPKAKKATSRFADQDLQSQSANDESKYKNQLITLRNRLKNKLLQAESVTSSFAPSQWAGIDTRACVNNERNCLGDTRDTDSYRFSASTKLQNGEVLILTGINHTKTKNATYVSLSINDTSVLRPAIVQKEGNSLSGISEVGNYARLTSPPKYLNNSANRLMKNLGLKTSDLPDLGLFYAVIIARNCSGVPNCFKLPTSSTNGIPIGTSLRILQRAYIKPNSSRGPKYQLLVSPYMIEGILK